MTDKAKHTILGGKVQLYMRPRSSVWQCSAYIKGKNRRVSTKEKSLATAKEIAEDWYLDLRGKSKRGELVDEITFKYAADHFKREYDALTQGQRSPVYIEGHHIRLRVHLIPYFGNMGVSQITAGAVQEYRIHRMTKPRDWDDDEKSRTWKPPAFATLQTETITLRQVLKTAFRYGWLKHVPDISPPYKESTKISHRAWFSPEEYKSLYEATRKKVSEAQGMHWQWAAEQLHDMILFMANTGLRPDEVKRLEFRDVCIAEDPNSDDRILEIEVRGKRGVGYCKSTPGAVRPFERLRDRKRPVGGRAKARGSKPKEEPTTGTDLIFSVNHKKQFNKVLNELDLKVDRDGNRRTAYSLRHTYICLRLMEGADIYQIAKNCRTSVEMIEKYYASHIKNRLDTALINVRRSREP